MSEAKAPEGQIRTEAHGHVFKIIIDNAAKKKAFSPQMMWQMSDALTVLDRTDDYWVGVVCAEGTDFTARLPRPLVRLHHKRIDARRASSPDSAGPVCLDFWLRCPHACRFCEQPGAT